jgi:hypothetical protein
MKRVHHLKLTAENASDEEDDGREPENHKETK